MPYYASLDKIASAETALGAPIALEDSLVLKQLVVALGNVTAGGGGGTGDVVGPASSVDGQIAMFDGITGKLLKASGVKALSNTLALPGAVSGTSTLQAPAVAGTAVVTLPSVTGTLAIIGNTVSQFAAGGTLSSLTGFSLRSTAAAFDLSLATDEALTANRTLSFNVGNADRTLTIAESMSVAGRNVANTFTGKQTLSSNASSVLSFSGGANTPAIGIGSTLLNISLFDGAAIICDYFNFGIRYAVSAQVGWGGSAGVCDALFMRKAAATIQMGVDAAGVTNQMFTAASRITSDGVGANLTIAAGNGRGAAGGTLVLSTYDTAGAATIGTLRSRMTFDTAGAVAFPVVTAVTTETVVSDTTWPVTINGVAYKICLKA